MISIQPKWVEKILNREKDREIRTTMPKCELPIDAYIYCTQAKPYLKDFKFINEYTETRFYLDNKQDEISFLNGKVVAKFTLKDIDEVIMPVDFTEENPRELSIINRSCLTGQELLNYLGGSVFKNFYAWHIDNLEIFDKPKELSEFTYRCIDDSKCENCPYYYCHNTESDSEKGCSCDCRKPITKAPQSWQFVEVE